MILRFDSDNTPPKAGKDPALGGVLYYFASFLRRKKAASQNSQLFWRKERDSNPRWVYGPHTISSRAP